MNQGLFRKQSLDQLASPEQLDQLMPVVTFRDSLILGTLGGLILLLLVWAVVGRLQINVEGRGAFINPKIALSATAHVVDFQAPGTGLLTSLNIKRGEQVKKGQVLGLIDHPDQRQQLRIEQELLAELLAQEHSMQTVQDQKSLLDHRAIAQQRAGLEAEVRRSRKLLPVTTEQSLAALREQHKSYLVRLEDARKIAASLKEGLEARQKLRDAELISDSLFLTAQRDYLGALDEISTLATRIRELDSREAEIKKANYAELARIASLESQLKDLDSREKMIEIDTLQGQGTRRAQINEAKRRIAQLEESIKDTSEIRAEASGRVLEITGILGQMVTQGARLGSIKLEDAGEENHLASVAYFTIGDGRRMRPGMKVQITPDTVKREEFGGILGTVTSVSEYPVTVEGVANIVNNPVMAASLSEGGRIIEVFFTLTPDPNTKSGFRWSSSRGPNLRILPGVTNVARVTVEQRAPISFVLPFLRSIAGG